MSTNRTNDLLAEGASQAAALTDGFKLAFLIVEAEPEVLCGADEVPQPALSSEAA